MSQDAANPFVNATVSASAGSGKTWLLVTRIVRLLLAGAAPGNIIALTFTRKAAGEMQVRLNERLREMALADDAELTRLLEETGCTDNRQNHQQARRLYEACLHSLQPIKLMTFHSFCQDILSRFPLEADVPPGFILTEETGLIEQQAWQALFAEATRQPESLLNRHLDTLMAHCNGVTNTRQSLSQFIRYRSDWWAFVRHRNEPVAFACTRLQEQLQVDEDTRPARDFFHRIAPSALKIFANLLREQNIATTNEAASIIDQALSPGNAPEVCFEQLQPAFLTQEMQPRKRKSNKTLIKKLGEENARKFLDLHQTICEAILYCRDRQLRLDHLRVNHAWYYCGHRLLSLFQQIKRRQRLLDFTDLEWKCFELISGVDNAQWIQYKIDQRIDHILIDEFQDTNPTQWHLLAPLLEEMASSEDGRHRSVFLVGDEKQSIYSFRRAKPELQAQASDWLAAHLHARATSLDASWRSSPAIIDCVNRIFQTGSGAPMPRFSKHRTHLDTLPGAVCLTELFQGEETERRTEDTFRNPLLARRDEAGNNPRVGEAEFIAAQIEQLLDAASAATVVEGGRSRPVTCDDILILMRQKTHARIYEDALRAHQIPFISNKKGGLLDSTEVQDLLCLLKILQIPHDNLALAQVLKSPLFDASDDDLMQLAANDTSPSWYERLQRLVAGTQVSHALQRAATLLAEWRKLAASLPVHDCLDRIFMQGDLLARYLAASPANRQRQVAANCQRLLELSLDHDSGRYPGIHRFLQHLRHTLLYADDQLDEPLVDHRQSHVRLLTIHASKGLEAPIVFLVDCDSGSTDKNAHHGFVNWPVEYAAPSHFLLQSNARSTDQITASLQRVRKNELARENLNLLYVALTRARQQLFISGVKSKKKSSGWYQWIHDAMQSLGEARSSETGPEQWIYHYRGDPPPAVTPATSPTAETPPSACAAIDAEKRQAMQRPLDIGQQAALLLAPSKTTHPHASPLEATETASGDARLRGRIIHRAIELLAPDCRHPQEPPALPAVTKRLAADFQRHPDDRLIQLGLREARRVVERPELREIFRTEPEAIIYNELPVLYRADDTPASGSCTDHTRPDRCAPGVYGLVDRVVKKAGETLIVDYKSHSLSATDDHRLAAEPFRGQLDYYRRGLEAIWPDQTFRCGILFTRTARIVWL